MKLYQRIKERREELGLSQDDLAQRMGYRSRSTIAKIESGKNDIPQSKITAFAKALSTNEAWLMGYDVPMERNDYEDPEIVKRDNILENIEKILKTKSWSLSCDTYDDDYFTIKNANGQTIVGLYNYELISRYQSLKKKGKVTADLLVSSESVFKKYLESLGFYIGRDEPEHKPFKIGRAHV